MTQKKIIGLISVQGLPANYGAFEQTCSQLAEYFEKTASNVQLYVGCTHDVFAMDYDRENVTRRAFNRGSGIGTIAYGLKTVAWCYKSGCRDIIVFGYALAPFFAFFSLLGIRVICNVDGIEWKRQKWSNLAKYYFKWCERMAVNSSAKLIYDSFNLARYYNITHQRAGNLIFYGSETYDLKHLKDIFISAQKDFDIIENEYVHCVMRLEPENNIKMIVEGYLQSNIPQKLIIIGPSTNYFNEEILPIINDSDRIIWTGGIYNRDLLMAIRAFSYCYIHGHRVGGTNPTLVEALHLKSRVFAYKSIFNAEMVDETCLFSSSTQLADLLSNKTPTKIHVNDIELYTWDNVCHAYAQLIGKK